MTTNRHEHQLTVETPLGVLRVLGTGDAVTAVLWPEQHGGLERDVPTALLRRAASALGEYLAGKRPPFDLPLAPQGTEFQQAVWRQLQRIPFGTTCSYGELAASMGKPTAARAVGAAIGKNPLSIIVPCHRVIGSTGKLTGFAGGLDRKQWLLAHEARHR